MKTQQIPGLQILNPLLILVACIFCSNTSTAQSDYRHSLLDYAVAPNTIVNTSDFEVKNSQIAVTGLYAPLSNDIPGIQNSLGVNRIFLSLIHNNGTMIHKAYLLNAIDAFQIQANYRYIVQEVKEDGFGYVICGMMNSILTGNSYSRAFVLKVDQWGDYQWFRTYQIPASLSCCWNSIEPIKNANNVTIGYLAAGYRVDNQYIKRAVMIRIDTVGNVANTLYQLQEAPIFGYAMQSEYTKVIRYDQQHLAAIGYCGLIGDNCGKFLQQDILLTIYSLNHSIASKRLGTSGFGAFNRRIDEGISLVKIPMGLMLLSRYYNGNGLPCVTQPDHLGCLSQVLIGTPMNPASWFVSKSLKYNAYSGFGFGDYPKDLLYETASGNSPNVWAYGQYFGNRSYLFRMNMTSGNFLQTPRLMNNHGGAANVESRTIAWNSLNRVIGLTNLMTNKYSVFEIVNNGNQGCKSDSTWFSFLGDSVYTDLRNHDSLTCLSYFVQHFSSDVTVNQTNLCGTLVARPVQGEGKVDGGSDLKLFPNPADNQLTLRFNLENKSDCRVRIYHLLGRGVFDRRYVGLDAGVQDLTMDVSGLSAGVYMLVLDHSWGVQTLRFVKH